LLEIELEILVRNRVRNICYKLSYLSIRIISQLELIELVIDQNELKYLLHYYIVRNRVRIFFRNRVRIICPLEIFVR
jgi:hypothetical protein